MRPALRGHSSAHPVLSSVAPRHDSVKSATAPSVSIGNGWPRLRAPLAAFAGLGILLSTPLARAADPPATDTWAAKIAALQNQVETKKKADSGWSPSILHQALNDSDRIRTGPASRAALLYSDRTLHRINEKSEVEILPPSGGQPGLLKVISGTHYFSSRSPKDYGRIETPTVTAAIKGTEFVVEVGEDTSTKITMLEGVVEATNTFGTLIVGRGEQAFVEPGKAPVKRIVVHPRDAVSWALYYPPVLSGSDARKLQALGSDGASLSRAAEMLGSGQVDAARPLIDGARRTSPNNSVALALASVVEIASNNKDEGMKLAEQAVSADPTSSAAALALSFAAQSSFDIARARTMAEKAASLDPDSALALARVAELRMAEGDLDGARDAARRAVAKNPGDSRALAVLGYIELAQYRSEEAERLLQQAVTSDPSSTLARMGLGLAMIRRGRLSAGREEIQTATALAPDDSLLRSYLAKALYEEKRTSDAAKELATAKELDPRDPTPYLYSAILMQDQNRPVEALQDLRASIERNDNRAVYRSRLLLDQDRAVRGTDLARIYNDLGFEQLGLVTARRSADADPSNFSSHLFLAGNYRNLPGFAPSFLSEILQARIYQPVSVNAARPDVVNESVSFNEYTALFDRPRLRGFGNVTYGRTNSNLSELFVSDPAFRDAVEVNRSGIHSGQAIGTANGERYALAIGYQKIDDDGFRFNADRAIANYRGFFEYAPTYRDTFQVNVLSGRQDTGDVLPLGFFPAIIATNRFDARLWNVGLGYHRIVSTASDFVVSAIYNVTRQTNRPFDCVGGSLECVPEFTGAKSTGILSGPQVEAQQVYRQRDTTWLFGLGGFRGDVTVRGKALAPFPAPPGETVPFKLSGDDEFTNGYAYVSLRLLRPFEITVGASGEKVVSPSGMLVPTNSQIGLADLSFEETRVSPKLGVSLTLPTKTTLRAAGFYRLSPAIGRVQTLEPTQVAGFNQFFREPGGTRSRSYGAGVDQELGSRLFGGASILFRRLNVPEASCDDPDPTTGCLGHTATIIDSKTSRNVDASAYFNAVLTKRLALAVEYLYQKRDFDTTQVSNLGQFEDHSDTRRLKPTVRWFLPCGFFAGATGTWYLQKTDQFEDLSSPERHVATDDFWIVDLQAGYKLPKRYGSIVFNAYNVGDREFEFYDRAVEDTVIPARTVTVGINVTY